MKKRTNKGENAITLIALVITIIILIILVAVTIKSITGDESIIDLAKNSVVDYKIAEGTDQKIIEDAFDKAKKTPKATIDSITDITYKRFTVKTIVEGDLSKLDRLEVHTINGDGSSAIAKTIEEVTDTELDIVVDTLSAGTTYTVFVRAYDNAGNYQDSNNSSVTTEDSIYYSSITIRDLMTNAGATVWGDYGWVLTGGTTRQLYCWHKPNA